MVLQKSKGSSADAKAWAFVSVLLPTVSTPPGFFSLLRCRQSLCLFCESAVLPVSVSGTVGDASL